MAPQKSQFQTTSPPVFNNLATVPFLIRRGDFSAAPFILSGIAV
jgi:hypothetical protein